MGNQLILMILVLVGIGTVFDLGVWVYVKDLNVFEDDNIKKTDVAKINE